MNQSTFLGARASLLVTKGIPNRSDRTLLAAYGLTTSNKGRYDRSILTMSNKKL